MNKILIGPAGDYEIGESVLKNGADELFLGLNNWSLRSPCFEMSYKKIADLHRYAIENNKKIRVCLNTYPWEHDIQSFDYEIERLVALGVRSFVLSDIANISCLHSRYPDIDIQASVACDIRNIDDVKVLEEAGASSVTLSSTTTDFIKLIKASTDVDVVIFAHGYINYTYRARCYMSSYVRHSYIVGSTNRDGASGSFNREGHCNRACKCNWTLHSNQVSLGNVTMNSYPYSAVAQLGDLLRAGADALKIQGRENTYNLVVDAIVFYRQVLDQFMKDPVNYNISPDLIERSQVIDRKRQQEMRSRSGVMIRELLGMDPYGNLV
ncbi:MAG: U32 family peptidase [Desulfobacteraceae bacterium]|nr:U32 family peptidase [Desulfobacteraceae bacterium]